VWNNERSADGPLVRAKSGRLVQRLALVGRANSIPLNAINELAMFQDTTFDVKKRS
jgi:hypothetical protein